MKRGILICAVVSLLSACATPTTEKNIEAQYDFSASVTAKNRSYWGDTIIRVQQGAGWLYQTNAVSYRTSEDELKRQFYPDVSWATPAPILLQQRLRLQLSSRDENAHGSCTLNVELKEFGQVIHPENKSEMVLEASATLLNYDNRVISRRVFKHKKPIESSDGRALAEGAATVSQEFGEALDSWHYVLSRRSAKGQTACQPRFVVSHTEFGAYYDARDGAPFGRGYVVESVKHLKHRPGNSFGWQIHVKSESKTLRMREEYFLPAVSKDWGIDDSATVLLDGGRIAVTERDVDVSSGIVSSFWSLTKGDPRGPYRFRVFLNGEKVLEDQIDVR